MQSGKDDRNRHSESIPGSGANRNRAIYDLFVRNFLTRRLAPGSYARFQSKDIYYYSVCHTFLPLGSSQIPLNPSSVRFGNCMGGYSLYVAQQFINLPMHFLVREDYFPPPPPPPPPPGGGRKKKNSIRVGCE